MIFEQWMEFQTRAENHRTSRDYDRVLSLKNWFFQFTNNFYMLFHIAFLKYNGSVLGVDSYCQTDSGEQTENCMTELQLQLAFIFLSRTVLSQIAKSLVPFVRVHFYRHYQRSSRDLGSSRDCN